MAESIESNPNQFHYEIKSAGIVSAPSGPGSTGVVSAPHVTGGAGNVTGIEVNTNVGDVTIAHAQASDNHRAEIVQDLRTIADELRSKSGPSAKRLAPMLRALKSHVAPAVLIAVTAQTLTHVAGVQGLPSL